VEADSSSEETAVKGGCGIQGRAEEAPERSATIYFVLVIVPFKER
jgi:hypothetical protein